MKTKENPIRENPI